MDHQHLTRSEHPDVTSTAGAAARHPALPSDARVGHNPAVLSILNDYTTRLAGETNRHIDGYAFGPNPSGDYKFFAGKGAITICYYWDSRHVAQGEMTITDGDFVLGRYNEGKTTWSD